MNESPRAGSGKGAETVYNRIAMLRAERKVSRRELADALGVHYQTVGYLERGEYSPSLYLALRIAAYFEVPVEVIFSTEPFPRLGSAPAASAGLEIGPVRRAVAVEAVVGPLWVLAPGSVGVLRALLGQQRTADGACHGGDGPRRDRRGLPGVCVRS
jgi:DNA-binding XRE family transcriptional regulator